MTNVPSDDAHNSTDGLPEPIFSVSFTLLILFIALGDGLGYFLKAAVNLPSPHLLILPFFGFLLLFAFALLPNRDPGSAFRGIVTFSTLLVVWLFVQEAFIGRAYILGYGQLAIFLVFLFLTRQLFETTDRLVGRLMGSVLVIHYVQCACIIVAALAWFVFSVNLNPLDLVRPTEIGEYYGFRAAGLSREPAWAAFAIGCTYLAIHYLLPSQRSMALLAFLVAAIFTNTGTGYLLALVFCAAHLFERRSIEVWAVGVFGVLLALAGLTYLQWDRLIVVWQGMDPSTNMRLASAGVALDVIRATFPLGTGYGNFRDFGVYGAEFDRYLDLYKTAFYKSDVLLLNLVAELGAFGLLVAGWILRVLWVPGYWLPILMGVLLLGLFGTSLVPPILLVAAVTGVLAARRAEARVHDAAENEAENSSREEADVAAGSDRMGGGWRST